MTAPVLFLVDDLAEGVPAPEHPFHQADPAAPQVEVMDLSVTRGDGIFETAGIIDGRPQALDAHLARFANSARICDLPAPKLNVWRSAIEVAAATHGSPRPSFAKFILTRGVEGRGIPTGWVYVAEAEDFSEVRANGIAVVTLDRGYRHDVAKTSPWLLQGAKTLSYAVNKSALREAARRGAEDVIFVSIDGYVLEGPTSNVLARFGDTIATPSTDQGILAGTTQGDAFEYLADRGLRTEYRRIAVEELRDADALWLLSSSRLAAPVRALDGVTRTVDHALGDALNDFLLARRH